MSNNLPPKLHPSDLEHLEGVIKARCDAQAERLAARFTVLEQELRRDIAKYLAESSREWLKQLEDETKPKR